MPYLIYKATSPSGKSYIGLTSQQLQGRAHQHYTHAKSSDRFPFYKALRKYGKQIVWEVLESGLSSLEVAGDRERHFISQYQSNVAGKGYNCTEGGDVGRPVGSHSVYDSHPVMRSDGAVFISALSAAKIMGGCKDAVSKAIRNNGTCAGFSFKKISLEEYETLKNNSMPSSPVVWTLARSFSDEVKQKISKTKKGQPVKRTFNGEKNRLKAISKPVLCSDGREFSSMLEVAKAFGIPQSSVYYSVKTGYPRSGVTFEFAKEVQQGG